MGIRLIETEGFIKKANRIVNKNKYLDARLNSVLSKLVANPFDPSLRTHKLKGKLSEYYSSSVTSNVRIVFKFVKENDELCILLLAIGTHEEIY